MTQLPARRRQDYEDGREWNRVCAQDLLDHKHEWLSYTALKAVGSAKPKHPDFKRPGSELSLWYNAWGIAKETIAQIRQADANGKIPKAP